MMLAPGRPPRGSAWRFVDFEQRQVLAAVIEIQAARTLHRRVVDQRLAIAASAAVSARFSPGGFAGAIIALPISRITGAASAKSRLIRPS